MSAGPDILHHRLKGLPRVRLDHFPTPLEKMDRLAVHLSEESGRQAPSLWVKRDDCAGVATGGNRAMWPKPGKRRRMLTVIVRSVVI